jgi:hypothetical protein
MLPTWMDGLPASCQRSVIDQPGRRSVLETIVTPALSEVVEPELDPSPLQAARSRVKASAVVLMRILSYERKPDAAS